MLTSKVSAAPAHLRAAPTPALPLAHGCRQVPCSRSKQAAQRVVVRDGRGPITLERSALNVDELVARTSSHSSLFTPTFKAVLAQALERGVHGKEIRGFLEEQQLDEECIGDQEALLTHALKVSQENLARLQSIRANAQRLADEEAKQAERLSMALSKARADTVYYENVQKMSDAVSAHAKQIEQQLEEDNEPLEDEEAREAQARHAANIIFSEVHRLEAAGLSF